MGEPLRLRVRALVGASWAPYALAGVLLAADELILSTGLGHVGPGYGTWALDHHAYTDVLKLSGQHYVRPGGVIHPVPYLQDRIEYPIIIGFLLWLPSWLPGGPASWLAAAGVLCAAATAGAIALLRRVRPGAAWWVAASPALLVGAGVNWDMVGIVLMLAALVWFVESRWSLSGAATAAGTLTKLFPIVALPVALAALARRARAGDAGPLRRWAGWFAVVGVVVLAPFALAAPANVWWFVDFNSTRPEKDSLFGPLLPGPVIDAVSLVVVAAVAIWCARAVWRAADELAGRAVVLGAAATLVAWMAVNKIWNPQYVLWVFAACGLAGAPAGAGVALGAVTVADWWYEFVLRIPSHHASYAAVGVAVTVARGAVLIWLAAWCLRALAGRVQPAGTSPMASAALR